MWVCVKQQLKADRGLGFIQLCPSADLDTHTHSHSHQSSSVLSLFLSVGEHNKGSYVHIKFKCLKTSTSVCDKWMNSVEISSSFSISVPKSFIKSHCCGFCYHMKPSLHAYFTSVNLLFFCL